MQSLIIGKGQVGESLHKVIGGELADRHEEKIGEIDILHICFPYTKDFENEVNRYYLLYKPKYLVIHSTVPIGTTRGLKAYHSPIRGMHPNLADSLLTFTKYLAPPNKTLRDYFEGFGIEIYEGEKPEDIEALKLWDTTYYALCVVFEKEVYKYCEENELDFDIVYRHANETYNEGYEKMGISQVRRPVLKHMPGRIGGHCMISNCKLLKFSISDYIIKKDAYY